MIIKKLIALGSVVFLTACATTEPVTPFKPYNLSINEQYTQASSGMTFPLTVGDFKRGDLRVYVEDISDISAPYYYRDSATPILVTVYSTQATKFISIGSPQSVKDEMRQNLFDNYFTGHKNQILRIYGEDKQTEAGNYTLIQPGQTLEGRYAKFAYHTKFAGNMRDVESYLYLFQVDKTYYKYRVTHPVMDAETALITDFLTALALPLPVE